jgi:ABC-2 type transport system permease protein
MKAFWSIFKSEFKLAGTSPDMLLFGLGFPVGIMLLIGFISKPMAVQLSFGGIVAFGISACGLMGLPLSLSDYRHRKILKRLKATPVSPALLLGAQALTQWIFSIISAAMVAAIAVLVFGVRIEGQPWRFAMSFLFVQLAIFSLGFLIAGLSPNMKAANAACSLLHFPMIFLSGASVPYEILPAPLRAVSDFFPLTQGIKILKGAVTGAPASESLIGFVFLGIMALAAYGLAIRFFRWE